MTLGAIPEAKVPREDELEREEKFSSGRRIVVAIDHGPNSQQAFTWALDQFVTHIDTIYLLHVLPKTGGSDSSAVYDATQLLVEKLTREAHEKRSVRILSVFKSGEVGKEICAEAIKIKATAIIMGCRGLGSVKSMLVGSATDYCARYSPIPLIIVPHNYKPEVVNPEEETAEEHSKLTKPAVDAR